MREMLKEEKNQWQNQNSATQNVVGTPILQKRLMLLKGDTLLEDQDRSM